MILDQANTGSLMRWLATEEVDWDAVYAEQLPRIYNYFRFRMGNSAEAEDLTSRTFEKAWRARNRYRRDRAGFSTWLYTIAQNVGLDHVRSRRSLLPIDAALEVTVGTTPQDDIERDSNLARLATLTARLPERERELIAFKYGAALNNRQIAKLTGLSESNVGTLLHRAVRALRSKW